MQLPHAPALRPGGRNSMAQAAHLSSVPEHQASLPNSTSALNGLPPQVKLEPAVLEEHEQGRASGLAHAQTGPSSMAEVNGLNDSDFAHMAPDLHEAAGGVPQSLPFSASEINLANYATWSSPSRAGLLGERTGDLMGFPRNFSLSDLALDQLGSDSDLPQQDVPQDLPRNLSMSALAPMEGDRTLQEE